MPFSFEMPKWWEMREGRHHPGHSRRQAHGRRARATCPSATRTSRSSRPAPCGRSIDFDTCVKCTLCWIQCPRLLLRRDARRALRRQHGGVLRLRGVRGGVPGEGLHHDGQRGGLRRQRQPVGDVAPGQGRVPALDDRARSATRSHIVRSHGFRFRGQYEEELDSRTSSRAAAEITAGIPGRERASQASRAPSDGEEDMPWQSRPSAGYGGTDDKEMLISGQRGRRGGPDARRHRRGHGVSDPALRHRDAGHRQEDRQRPARGRVHRGRGRAQPVRDRQARLHRGRARLLRLLRRGLDVRDGVPHGHARRSACRWSALVGNRALDDPGAFGVEHNDALVVRDLGWLLIWVDTAQEALDTTLIAYRVAEDRRVFLPIAISADGAFLTHSQTHHAGAAQGEGRPVPAPVRPGRPPAAPRQSRSRWRPQANEDWVIEIRRQNDEAMKRAVRRDRGGLRRLPQRVRPRAGEPVVRGVHDGGRRHHPDGHGDDLAALQGRRSANMRAQGKKVGLDPAPLVPAVPDGEAGRGAVRAPRRSGSSTATTRSGRPSARAWSPTRSAPPCTTPSKRPPLLGFICGLGGREVTLEDVVQGDGHLLRGGQRPGKCRRARRTGSACASKESEPWPTPDVHERDADPRALQGRQEGHHRGVLHLRSPDLPGLRVGAGDEADGQGVRAAHHRARARPAACTWPTRRTTRRRGWCRGCTPSSAPPARRRSARRPG